MASVVDVSGPAVRAGGGRSDAQKDQEQHDPGQQ
jgi:hypothetical protein